MNNKADLSNQSVEWYTPSEIIEATREVLTNGIQLDLASSFTANQTVQATSYFTKENSYLDFDIQSLVPLSCYCNPPSRALRKPVNGTKSEASAFWRKLVSEYKQGLILDAIYLCVSSKLIHLNADMLNYPICITTNKNTSDCVTNLGRIKFVSPEYTNNIPTQGNAIILLPNRDNEDKQIKLFGNKFKKFGSVGVFCEIDS